VESHSNQSSPNVISSRQNSHVRQLRAAFAGNPRLSRGLVAIEGGHLVAEALRSGIALQSIFLSRTASQKHAEEFALIQQRASAPLHVLADDVFRSAAGTDSPQGIAALITPPKHSLDAVLSAPTPHSSAPLLLALDALQDPGNLGTLIRSAEAFGATGVLCLPGTASPWSQKSLRASVGSAFRLKVASTSIESFGKLAKRGVKIFAAVPTGGISITEADLAQPSVLLIGNEGAGISAAALAHAHARITLRTPGPVESLNAAIAGSLLLYEASRQRATKEIPAETDHVAL
jgi:TrmH family RNA methyltransferase